LPFYIIMSLANTHYYRSFMLTYILFAVGFALLIKGADWLVKGASALAGRLRVSSLIIGLTIVAFGTSTPELGVNLYASFQGTTDIAISNILGSNIFNILFILGVSAIICPLFVREDTVWKQIPLTLLAAVVLGILANDSLIDKASLSVLTRTDGIILLIFFMIFMYYIFETARGERKEGVELATGTKQYGLIKTISFIILGLVCLSLGSKWMVDGAVKLAEALGASQSLIGLTIVAVGTSLPELATSAVAAYRKNVGIAVGNIVGSNIFNIFFILGVSSVVTPLPFSAASNIDTGVTIMASALLFIAMFTGAKRHLLERWEGIIFITLYVGFIAYSILRG
jgi:cation:H+ antiporter